MSWLPNRQRKVPLGSSFHCRWHFLHLINEREPGNEFPAANAVRTLKCSSLEMQKMPHKQTGFEPTISRWMEMISRLSEAAHVRFSMCVYELNKGHIHTSYWVKVERLFQSCGEEDSNPKAWDYEPCAFPFAPQSSCSSSKSIHAVVVVVVGVVVLVAFGIVVVAAVTEAEVKTLYWHSGLWLCIHTNKICGS